RYSRFALEFQDKSLKTFYWNRIFFRSSEILGTLDTSPISLMLVLTTYTNHGEHLLPSSTSAEVAKKLEWTRFVENKDAKKTNKISYPKFTKIIINYFMSKDQSISRRNKMFWHTTRDDTMFTFMRCISRHEDTQVYGAILPMELTNQAMLESKAYKTYYAFASGEKALKPKYVRKKADSDTSPKKKPVQSTKGTRLKTQAKVAKSDKKKKHAMLPKPKGLNVLSVVALTEAEQIKLATERSKKQFHSSHASGSGDGVDIQSKVLNKQQQKTSGIDEGTGTKPGAPDVPKYDSESEKESWGDSDEEDDEDEDDFEDDDGDNDDADDNDDDDGDNDDGDDNDGNDDDEADSERTESDREDIPNLKDLYKDVNVNLGIEDAEMTDVDQGGAEQQNVSQVLGFEQVVEDTHMIVTPVLDEQKTDDPVQSSYVSSDFTIKLLNLDNTPPRFDETNSQTSFLFTVLVTAILEIISATTVPPPPPFFNPLQQEATPTST
ncbi:hypothetical protein Tco_1412017, partial [Tanacetum coccineum]